MLSSEIHKVMGKEFCFKLTLTRFRLYFRIKLHLNNYLVSIYLHNTVFKLYGNYQKKKNEEKNQASVLWF